MAPPRPQKPASTSSDWLKPAAVVVGLLICLVGTSMFWSGMTQPPGEKPHQDFVTGVILMGGALGLIAAALGWFDSRSPQSSVKTGAYYGTGAALAAVIGLFIRRYGMHQIGGFDHSVLVDTAWRLYKGQIPYVDFPCTLPAAFILGAKFAFQWFGANWSAFVDITALFALGSFAWSIFLLTELFGRQWTTLFYAIALQAISLMLVAYWWYNPITAVTSVLYILSAALWLRRPALWSAAASYGVSLLLMASMKPNAAGILIPLVSIVLFLSKPLRWKTLVISVGALVMFVALLSINHISFTGMIKGFLSVAQRGASMEQFLQDLSPVAKRAALLAAGIVVIPVALALFQGRKSLRSRPPFIALIALAAGIYGFITNGEQKLVDMPLVLFGAILLVAELRCPNLPASGPAFSMPSGWNRYLTWVCVVLAAGGVAQGIGRDRIKAIGMPLFFEYNDTRHTLSGGFFQGLHCGDVFDELIREITAVLHQEESSSIWFGPRMQWSYAAFNKPSPHNQPAWWHPGVAFAKADEELYFNRFLASRFDVLILFKNDVAYFSQDEVRRMTEQYNVDQSLPLLTILRLKK